MICFNQEKIIIIEKPQSIEWETIHGIIYTAHMNADKDGGAQATAFYSGEELQNKIGEGKCFVALDGNMVVGTCSVVIKNINTWFYNGLAAYYMWDAILPDYQGRGIYSLLDEARNKYIVGQKIRVIITRTSERNRKMLRIKIHNDYRRVSFSATTQTSYYSVLLAKWVDKCPYSKWYCFVRYKLTEIKTKMLYKEGGSKTGLMLMYSRLRSVLE